MKHRNACLLIALALSLAPLVSSGAEIELRDGTTVTGTIEGRIVLGGRIDEKPPGNRKAVLGGIFFVLPGADIVSITKKGVETVKDAGTFWALFAGKKLPPTAEVIALLNKLADNSNSEAWGEAFRQLLELGMAKFASSYDQNPIGVALMGEYVPESGGSLVPALRITTGDGVRTVDVASVVDYIAAAK